ncbi:MAG: nitrous oxide reductase accessory protein NosL [Nitrospirota bacterium]
MKRMAIVCFMISLVLLTGSVSFAEMLGKEACPFCGMEKEKFGHSWMVIEYDDGKKQGFCSIHCASLDLALHIDKTPASISVGDYTTKNLIDAEKAYWVIGGDKPGVMTKRAKWAFRMKNDAEAFMKEHGGTAATFDEAMKAAYEDMYTDTKMIRDKRKMMRMKKMERK